MENENISQPISKPVQPQTQNVPINQSKPRNTNVIIIAFLVVLFISMIVLIMGAYALGKNYNTPTPTPVVKNDPPPTPVEILNTYAGDGFVFVVPIGYEIQKQSANETVWKSEYTPGQFNYASMILSSQLTPFNKNQITTYPQGTENDQKITESISIENKKTLEIGSKQVTEYNANCGADCYLHVLEFTNNDQYYRLIFNGAGGGLLAKFESILKSLNFSDSTLSPYDATGMTCGAQFEMGNGGEPYCPSGYNCEFNEPGKPGTCKAQ